MVIADVIHTFSKKIMCVYRFFYSLNFNEMLIKFIYFDML